MRRFVVSLLVAVLMGGAATGCWAQPPAGGGRGAGEAGARVEDASVEYAILLTAPQTQMVDVSMTLRGYPEGPLDIVMPVWRPGRYAIHDFAGAVRDFAARSGEGRPLASEKTDKSTWRIASPPGDEVIVTYRVYANSLGDRMRHVDDSHAFISPCSVLMYAPALRSRALTVRIAAPEGWGVATGLERHPRDEGVLVAANYDVLVDSPIEVGRHERLTFDIDGTPHEIVIWNESGLPRTLAADRITRDFEKVVRAAHGVFGGALPYSRYVFLVHALPGGSGGTEHLNSTIMQTGTATFREEEAFKKFLGLVSHEYFHTWNVKQLRPAGLQPYDYTRENYTDLLWVAEGTTSYYDDLLLVRAGIVRPDEYLRTLGSAIDSYRRRPGSGVQSLHDSSFDAWIKHNRPSPDAVNSTVSFYDKGAMVSLVLDMEIRKRSEGKATLDTVMRDLFERFPLSGPGYTTADLVAACERAAGAAEGSFDRFFLDYVRGTKPLDFEGALKVVGLDVRQDQPRGGGANRDRASDRAGDEEETKDQDSGGKPYVGFSVEARDGFASVSSVLADGPAYEAGLIVGDLVIAIDGVRLKPGDLDARLKHLKPGETVRLTISRYDRLREIEIRPAGRNDARWAVSRLRSAEEAAKAAYKSWLGQSWPTGRRQAAPDREE